MFHILSERTHIGRQTAVQMLSTDNATSFSNTSHCKLALQRYHQQLYRMEKAPLEAVIAFYNKLSEKLSLESCNSASDARYLLHSMVEFITSGHLTYRSHDSFGFKSAVEFLQQNAFNSGQKLNVHCNAMEPKIYSLLDWERAEEGEEQAIAKVLIALLYELRLLQPKRFEQLACELSAQHNSQLAIMVKLMDEREDNWPSVLAVNGAAGMKPESTPLAARSKVAPGPAKTSSIFNSSLSQVCFSTPKHRPSLPFLSHHQMQQQRGELAERDQRRHSSVNFWSIYPESPEARLAALDEYSQSPLSYVLHSPRGSDVSRLRQQQRQIVDLKEQLEQMGRERDRLEEKQRLMKAHLVEGREERRLLEQRIAGMRCQVERIPSLEEKLADMHGENSRLLADVHKLESELDESRLQKCHLVAECEEANRRWESAGRELDALRDSVKALRRNLADEVQLHSATRERLAAKEGDYSRMESELQRRLESIESALHTERQSLVEKSGVREREMQAQLELASQVQHGYAEQIDGLEQQLALAQYERQSAETNSTEQAHEIENLRNELRGREAEFTSTLVQIQQLRHELTLRSSSVEEGALRIRELEVENHVLSAKLAESESVLEGYRSFVLRTTRTQQYAPTQKINNGGKLHVTQSYDAAMSLGGGTRRDSVYSSATGFAIEPSISAMSLFSAASPLSTVSTSSPTTTSSGMPNARADGVVVRDECYQERESVLLYQATLHRAESNTCDSGNSKSESTLIDSHTPLKPRRPLAPITFRPNYNCS